MFRRMMCLLTALLLCLAACPALAAGTVVPKWQEGELVRSFQAMVTVGDTVYFKVRSDEGGEIWHWREGMAQAAPLLTGLTFASSYRDIGDAYAALDKAKEEGGLTLPDVDHAISQIFTDGETLYAVNSLNGLVFTIGEEAGRAVFTDVVTVQDASAVAMNADQGRVENGCAAGDYLLLVEYVTEGTGRSLTHRYTLSCVSLTDGSVRASAVENVHQVFPYRDGKALLAVAAGQDSKWMPESYDLYIYDPATDAAQKAGTVTDVSRIAGFCYDSATDTVYYQDDREILGKENFGMPTVYAETPYSGSFRLAVAGNSLVMLQGNAAQSRRLERDHVAAAKIYVDGGRTDAIDSFILRYPDVSVYSWYNDAAAESTPAVADVRILESNAGDYDDLKAADALLDLSGSETIRAYVDSLYPPFRELAMKDGKIVGIPVKVTSNTGWYISRDVMAKLGLTVEEIPTSLTGLCAFISKWDDEKALQFSKYAIIENAWTHRERLTDLTMELWRQHLAAEGQPMHYNDPILIEVLTAIDNMDATNLDAALTVTDAEDSDYMQSLLWNGCLLVGNFSSYMEDFSDRILLPMTLTADTPWHAGITSVQMWCVSGETAVPEEAIALLECQLAAMSEKERAVMQTTFTEAVRNPEYESIIERTEESIQELREVAAVNGDMSYREIDAAIRVKKEFLKEGVLRQEYRVHRSALENYQQVIAPAMVVLDRKAMPEDAMIRNALYSLKEMFTERLIDVECYVTTADALLTVTPEMESGTPEEQRLYEMCRELSRMDSSGQYQKFVTEWFGGK